MNRILTASAIVALAALSAAPAFAATTAKPAPKAAVHKVVVKKKPVVATPAKPVVVTFKTLDANKDGKISFAELKKYWPKLAKADFAKYDTNKDGFYNHTELAAFAAATAPAKPSK